MTKDQLLVQAEKALVHMCHTCTAIGDEYNGELVQGVLDQLKQHLQQRCVVPNCENYKHHGVFVGDVCKPCYEYLTGHTKSTHSQLARNIQQQIAEANSNKQFVQKLHQVIGKYLKEQQ